MCFKKWNLAMAWHRANFNDEGRLKRRRSHSVNQVAHVWGDMMRCFSKIRKTAPLSESDEINEFLDSVECNKWL